VRRRRSTEARAGARGMRVILSSPPDPHVVRTWYRPQNEAERAFAQTPRNRRGPASLTRADDGIRTRDPNLGNSPLARDRRALPRKAPARAAFRSDRNRPLLTRAATGVWCGRGASRRLSLSASTTDRAP